MRRLKPCGTEAAYYRHKRNGEQPCPDCLDGLAEARMRRGTTTRKFRPARHGTHAKYAHGCRCEPCKQAKTEYMRRWRAKDTYEMRRGTLRDVILDYMITFDRPLQSHILAELIVDRHADIDVKSIRRVIYKMENEGLVEQFRRAGEVFWVPTQTGAAWFDNLVEAS